MPCVRCTVVPHRKAFEQGGPGRADLQRGGPVVGVADVQVLGERRSGRPIQRGEEPLSPTAENN